MSVKRIIWSSPIPGSRPLLNALTKPARDVKGTVYPVGWTFTNFDVKTVDGKPELHVQAGDGRLVTFR